MSETGFILEREPEPKDGDCIKAKLKDSSEFVHKKFGDIIDRNVFDVALEYIERLESAQPKWISVEDEQKPQHGKEYLCVCSLPDDPKRDWDWIMVLRWYAYGTNGYVDRPHFTDEGLNGMTVTHWMPLPEPPKEEA